MPTVGSGRVKAKTGKVTYTDDTASSSTTASAAASSSASATTPVLSVVGDNIGNGSGLFASASTSPNVLLNFRSLIAGSGIVLSESADSITITCNASGSGGSSSFTTLSDGPAAIVPNALVFGADAAHLAFTPAPTMAGQTLLWTGSAFEWAAPGAGAVTSIDVATTVGLTASGGPITSTGTLTLGLAASGVMAGSYTNPTMVIDRYGRVTAAASTSAPGVSSVGITSDSNIIAVGGPVTSTGTFALSLSHTGVTPGSYTLPTLSVDAYGRITSISGNTISTGVTSVGAASVIGTSLISSSSTTTAVALKTIIGANAVTVTSTDSSVTISVPSAVASVALTAGDGIAVSGNAITSTGTFSVALATSGATAGTYLAPTLTVDQYGRITAITSNTANVSTIEPGTGIVLTGVGDVTVGLDVSGVTAGTYTTPTLVVDATGRITSAASNSVGSVTGVSLVGTGPVTVAGSKISTNGTFSLGLAASGVTAGVYPLATVTVDSYGRVTAASAGSGSGGSGTVQSIAATGDGNIAVTGGPISSSGTLAFSLVPTGAAAGTYNNPTISIDSYGRVTAIAGGSTSSVSIVAASGDGNIVVSGSPITSAGTLALSLSSTGVVPGSYSTANVTVDTFGRIKTISSGGIGVTGVTVNAGNGISVGGSTISSTGTYTIGLSNSGVTSGSYVNPMLSVDQFGRILSISSATALSTGTYTNATVTVDGYGRISSVASTATSGSGGTVTSVGATGDGAVLVSGSAITTSGTLALSLSATGVAAGTYSYPTISVDAQGRVRTISTNSLPASVSSVTVQPGNGISVAGSTVTSTGTFVVGLATSGAASGTYSNPSLTVDTYGRITAISSNAAPVGTVTSVAASGDGNITVSGGPITSSGSLAIALAPTAVTAGTYVNPTFSVDSYGRVQSAASFAGATPGTYTNATVVIDQNGRVSSVTQGTAGSSAGVQTYSLQVYFDSTGNLAATNTFTNLPTGWSASRDGANQITITHNLGRPPANIVFYGQKSNYYNMKYANGNQPSSFSVGFPSANTTPNTFTVYAMSTSATDTDVSSYTLMYVLI